MMKKSCIIFLLVFLKFSSQEPSHAGKYRAAIVQYHPILWGDPTQNDKSEDNAKNYVKIIENAAAHDADIVVFPEFGLMGPFVDETFIPEKYDPEDIFKEYFKYLKNTMPELTINLTPCDQSIENGEALEMISCAARRKKIYIVLSTYEYEKCDYSIYAYCPYEIYNVVLVFDRTGTIIAKRRKKLLFDEPWAFSSYDEEPQVFTTDFGITFGLLSGIDFMDDEVTEKFSKSKIKNAILLTHKIQELPYFSLSNDMVYWSYVNKINLLVAGSTTDHAGGMILCKDDERIPRNHLKASENALIFVDGPESLKTRIELLSEDDLAIQTEGEESQAYSELATDIWNVQKFGKEIKKFNSILLPDYYTRDASYKVCTANDELCCHLDLSIEKDIPLESVEDYPNYRYHFMALRKTDSLGKRKNLMLDVCAIVACTSENVEDCGKVYKPYWILDYPLTFNTIKIRRTVKNIKGFHAPIMTEDDFKEKPMIGKNFRFHANKLSTNITDLIVELTNPTNRLLIFGINSRYYDLKKSVGFWTRLLNIDLDYDLDYFWKSLEILFFANFIVLGYSLIRFVNRRRYQRYTNERTDFNYRRISSSDENE